MYGVTEINEIDQLADFRAEWDSLIAQTPEANFFQTLDWLAAYWKHFGGGQRLRVLIVTRDGEIRGIVPLVVRQERKWRVARCRMLTWPLDDWGSFYGPISSEPEAVLRAALVHVRETARDWDVIDLRFNRLAEHDPCGAPDALQAAGFGSTLTYRSATAIVDLDGSWESFLAARTSKWRNNYRRWEKRLGLSGPVEFQRYRPRGAEYGDEDPRWDLFETCLDIARKSWQGSSTSGTTLSHPKVLPFFRDAHLAAVRSGGLDLNLLSVGGKPAAFAYNYQYQSNVFGLRAGFNGDSARDGAGNLLMVRSIQDSFERRDRSYDLGPGWLHLKRFVASRFEPIAQYTHYHPTVLGAHLVRLWRRARRRTSLARFQPPELCRTSLATL